VVPLVGATDYGPHALLPIAGLVAVQLAVATRHGIPAPSLTSSAHRTLSSSADPRLWRQSADLLRQRPFADGPTCDLQRFVAWFLRRLMASMVCPVRA
jgi:hypothetical protein